MKQCFKCARHLPLLDFYTHPGMKDGYLNKCKLCTKIDVGKNYRARFQQYREYEQGRSRTAGRKALRSRIQKEDRQNFPERYRARTAVNNALRDGRLSKPSACSLCGGGGRIHGHHPDYARPLEVLWLCVRCHHNLHPHHEERKPSHESFAPDSP